MVKGVATQVDQAAFSSNAATSTVPAGLLSYALPGTGAGGKVDIDGILDAVGAIQGHGGEPDTVFANPADITAIRKLKSTQGVYLLAPDGASVEGTPATRVGGCALIPTNGLSAGHALVAEARYVQLAIRRDASRRLLGRRAFTSDAVVARVTMRVDWSRRLTRGVLADLAMTKYRALVELVVAGEGVKAGATFEYERRAGRARGRVRARRAGARTSRKPKPAARTSQPEGDLMPAGWRA